MIDNKIVVLLPMKNHSERVPNKNFRLFAGKPLYRWMMDTLLSLEFVSLVVVNTDSERLLQDSELAANSRVLVRARPEHLCGDLVSMNAVIGDDIENTTAERYLMTHATNPLLSATTIRAAMKRFDHSPGYDSLFSVTKVQTRFYHADGTPVNHDPDNLVRTQDLEPWFEENSILYLFTRESYHRAGARIGAHPILFETPALESIDIDTADDWAIAEAIAQRAGMSNRSVP